MSGSEELQSKEKNKLKLTNRNTTTSTETKRRRTSNGCKNEELKNNKNSLSNGYTEATKTIDMGMSTRNEYKCLDWHDTKLQADIEELKKINAVEIPKWIVKEVSICYSIEGTENLSEEIFLKRHLKLEIDERRRKRWDIQKLRENRMIEKLRKRYMKEEYEESYKNVKNMSMLSSFYPNPSDVKFIQISNRIPVNAFGEVLPNFAIKRFCLPWKNGESSTLSPSTSLTKTRFFLKHKVHDQISSV